MSPWSPCKKPCYNIYCSNDCSCNPVTTTATPSQPPPARPQQLLESSTPVAALAPLEHVHYHHIHKSISGGPRGPSVDGPQLLVVTPDDGGARRGDVPATACRDS